MTAWTVGDKEQLAPYAVELRHILRRLVQHRVLPEKDSLEFVEDEPPPRAKPGTTEVGKMLYPLEQTLTTDEMESGVRVLDLPAGLGEGIRRAKG
jgi:hypothetical protein